MLDQYTRFLTSSTSAAAGFTGLLFVALSVVNRDESHEITRERRTLLAASAFLLLANIFFVSLLSSLGGSKTFATTSLVMAAVGLLGTSRLLPRPSGRETTRTATRNERSTSPSRRSPSPATPRNSFSRSRC